jgi:hypothetical protein
MELVTVKLPKPLATRLRATARRSGKGMSAIIREGIERRLRSEDRAVTGSVLEAASDLVGSLAGPRDLATNKKHLIGFGR